MLVFTEITITNIYLLISIILVSIYILFLQVFYFNKGDDKYYRFLKFFV